MTVYLELGGKSNKKEAFLFNLSNANNIFARVYSEGTARPNVLFWSIYNNLGDLKGYLKVDDFQIQCDYFKEVISVLYNDIIEALKTNKNNKNDTFIEVFNLDPVFCKGTDKYSLLVQDCQAQARKLEEEKQQKIRQSELDAVKDLVDKGTTRLFNVQGKYMYQVEKGYLKSNTIDYSIYGKNIEDVKAWIHKKFVWGEKSKSFFSELVGELEIEELPQYEVFACHARYRDGIANYKTTDLV